MVERPREKIALIVFAVVLVLGLLVAAGYVIAGHSLNIAATHIDDLVGSMDDYTVFVYQGTVEREDSAAQTRAASSDAATDRDDAVTQAPANDAFDAVASADDADALSEGQGSADADEAQAGDGGEDASAAGSDDAARHSRSDAASRVDGESLPASGGFLESLLSAGASVPDPPAPAEPVSVDDVAADYRDKGANVVVLPTDDLTRYATGRIVGSGGRRIGVFSVPAGSSLSDVRDVVAYFQLHEVDFIVAIAPTSAPVRLVEGIDVLVTTDRVGASSVGETYEGSYLVQAPATDSVGVVMVAPSLVVSSKVVAP